MAYANYDFYKAIYKGTMSEAAFERLSERASDYIDSRTGDVFAGRFFESGLVELKVKKACCAAADAYAINESGGSKQSESVDGYSVTYASGSKVKSADERLDAAVRMYIGDYIRAVTWV